MLLFHIESQYPAHTQYLLQTFGKSYGYDIRFSEQPNNALTFTLPNAFEDIVVHKQKPVFDTEGFILTLNNQRDYFTTAFYLLNCLQEFDGKNLDSLGRFQYGGSYQQRFNAIRKNTVQFCFDQMALQFGLKPTKQKSRFFLTHDIDSVYGAILEDGFNVLKKGRFDLFIKMLFRLAIGRPDWLNMDKIMKLESEYDCRSVFYWIVNKGRINKREINADYSFSSKQIQDQLSLVECKGFENGLHKSISAMSFELELLKFNNRPIGNRYHYLKFNLPIGFNSLEACGLKLDASLGFAEEFGFRNNYGLPFTPFNVHINKPYSFVEVPLHIMDRTFFQYKKTDVKETQNQILNFFEENKENCVLSILWHNTFFTDYKFKGYLNMYKSILGYIKENNFSTISQQEIIDQYSL